MAIQEDIESPQNEKIAEILGYLRELAGLPIPEKVPDESPHAQTINEMIARQERARDLIVPEEAVEPPAEPVEGEEELPGEELGGLGAEMEVRQPIPQATEYVLPIETFWAKITQEASGGGGEYDGWAEQRLDDDGAWEADAAGYSSAGGHGSLFDANGTEDIPVNTYVCVHEEYETDSGRRFVFAYDMSVDEKVASADGQTAGFLEDVTRGPDAWITLSRSGARIDWTHDVPSTAYYSQDCGTAPFSVDEKGHVCFTGFSAV